jgi:hypothetical protein
MRDVRRRRDPSACREVRRILEREDGRIVRPIRAFTLAAILCLLGSSSQIEAQSLSARDALRELRALRSVTTAGPTLEQYSARLLDTKVAVDRYLDSSTSDDPKLRRAIRLATTYFLLASWSWRKGTGAESPSLWSDKEASAACPKAGEGPLSARWKEQRINLSKAQFPLTRPKRI